MQVFVIGTPIETAKVLDGARLRKQIIEADQILDALSGQGAWSNHPCVLQYRDHEWWLRGYRNCLQLYSKGELKLAEIESFYTDGERPTFHTDEYFDQMKRRLFEKDEEHYKQWSHLGKSRDNWYYIDGKFVKYRNGKKVEE